MDDPVDPDWLLAQARDALGADGVETTPEPDELLEPEPEPEPEPVTTPETTSAVWEQPKVGKLCTYACDAALARDLKMAPCDLILALVTEVGPSSTTEAVVSLRLFPAASDEVPVRRNVDWIPRPYEVATSHAGKAWCR